MLSVSLHGIRISAPLGLYKQEQVLFNTCMVDVDVEVPDLQPWPYVDYTLIRQVVADAFSTPGLLLETLVLNIHTSLKATFPEALKVKVAISKLNPPMPGEIAYARVSFEQ
jgi:dihydroneopterin aldolase